MSNMKLDVIEIQVRDWAGMMKWYHSVLGLEILAREDDDKFAMLGNEGSIVALVQVDEVSGTPGNIMPYWRVENIENVVEKLTSSGVRFSTKVETTHWGKQAKFSDLEGNVHFLYQEERNF